jgi:hypothetical protein
VRPRPDPYAGGTAPDAIAALFDRCWKCRTIELELNLGDRRIATRSGFDHDRAGPDL